jgi:hypothetical protein
MNNKNYLTKKTETTHALKMFINDYIKVLKRNLNC